jgi:hypothetical protein
MVDTPEHLWASHNKLVCSAALCSCAKGLPPGPGRKLHVPEEHVSVQQAGTMPSPSLVARYCRAPTLLILAQCPLQTVAAAEQGSLRLIHHNPHVFSGERDPLRGWIVGISGDVRFGCGTLVDIQQARKGIPDCSQGLRIRANTVNLHEALSLAHAPSQRGERGNTQGVVSLIICRQIQARNRVGRACDGHSQPDTTWWESVSSISITTAVKLSCTLTSLPCMHLAVQYSGNF